MNFSIASVIGAAVGFTMIIGAVVHGTDNLASFLSFEGIMIVVGGSLAVAFMSFQANYVVEALKAIGGMFMQATATHENLHHDLIDIIAWARIVKQKGLRGLEDEMDGKNKKGIKDPFIKYGLEMVVSNYTPDEVRGMMETAADACYERDTIPARVLMAMAGHAPAFGMVGTLVGMVIMLGNFSDDMSGVGSGLAIALLATLYGVITARMVYMPAAAKITQKQEGLRFRNHLITEGMAMLVANKSPRYIQDRLNSFLRPESHYNMDAKIGKATEKIAEEVLSSTKIAPTMDATKTPAAKPVVAAASASKPVVQAPKKGLN
jgi:chemotaxis protein MotA